jgi:hypothetical protein
MNLNLIPFTVHFMPIKPLLSDHLFYLNLYPCSLGRSHKTDLTVIDHLPIPDLILKLYTFNILLFELFPLQRTKWFLFNARATERIKNLSIIFLKFIDN